MAQRVGRGIALLFHDRGIRRWRVVSSTPRPHFTPGKDPVPILQEAGWVPGPVWTGGKSRPHGDSIPDRPARSQSLYRLSYPAHRKTKMLAEIWKGSLLKSGSLKDQEARRNSIMTDHEQNTLKEQEAFNSLALISRQLLC